MIKNKKEIDAVINKFIGKKGALIPLLQQVQAIENYLSKDTMRYVSEKSGIGLAKIYGVATFYTMFRLKPQGKHILRICKGTACHVSDVNAVADAINSELKLTGDEDTTKDGLFTVMDVACLGCCSLAPVIMINDDTYGTLIPNAVVKILKKYS